MNNVHDVSKAQAQEISEILSRIKEKGLSSSSGSSIPDVSSGDLNLDSLPSLSAPNDKRPFHQAWLRCRHMLRNASR